MRLKLIRLDNFYQNMSDPQVGLNFLEMSLIRSKGYGPEYSSGYLPLDASDFICWHYLLYLESEDGWVPISCWRHTSLNRCDYYRVVPPFLNTVKEADVHPHLEALEALISNCRLTHQELIYLGGLTILKSFRVDRELSNDVKEVVIATAYQEQQSRQCTLLSGGAMKFKTHLVLEKAGLEPLSWQGVSLPPFEKKSAFGAPMIVMALREGFSQWGKECFRKHSLLLQNIVHIGGAALPEVQEAVKKEDKKAA